MKPAFFLTLTFTLILAAPQADAQSPTLDALKDFPQAQKMFDTRMARAMRDVDRYKGLNRDGHLIIGRVRFEGNDDPESARSQMVVVEQGFFVDAIRDLKQPIGFRHHLYEPLDFVVPEDAVMNAEGIIDVGDVQMTKASEDRLVQISGTVKLPKGINSRDALVTFSIQNARANTPSNGTEGVGRRYQRLTTPVKPDGSFRSMNLSLGKYYVSVSCKGCVSQSRSIKIAAPVDSDFGTVELELPRQIDVQYRVVKYEEGSFDDVKTMVNSFPAGHRWKADSAVYGWDLEFPQTRNQVLMKYSYAPCYIKDLGEGELEDFLDVDPTAARDRPQGLVNSGHVYLLKQAAWKHYVLFKIEVGDPIAPGQKPPIGTPRLQSGLNLPAVVAHYSFNGHADDVNGTAASFALKNTEFAAGALKLNGIYENSGPDGFSAIVTTPALDYENFAISIRFRARKFSNQTRSILYGGTSYRWFGLSHLPNGSLILSLNNNKTSQVLDRFRIRANRWHEAVCAFNLSERFVAVSLDSQRPQVIPLPADFKLEIIGSAAEDRDKKWTFANYSNGNAFKGLIDELTIFKHTMTSAEFRKTMAELHEAEKESASE